MAEELTYKNEAAAGYDRAFAPITTHFVPFLLSAAHIAPGMRVLDIAAGTGLAAEAALGVVGPTGHITAADLSPAMVEKARVRFANAKNVSVAVEDGQALSFPDGSFDAVVCSLGLMFFPDPLRGLTEFSSRTSSGRPRRCFGEHSATAVLQYPYQPRHRAPCADPDGGFRSRLFARR
jgi:ubiquinone/menaquinone biosynthesis C-methylase UbiE